MVLDNNFEEGDTNKEGEISTGNKITGNGSSVSSMFQSSDDLHMSLTPGLEETFSNGLRTEDDSNGASLVLKTPFFEKTKACVIKIQEDKEYDMLEIQDEKIDDNVKKDDNRRGSFNLGYGGVGLKKNHSKNGDC